MFPIRQRADKEPFNDAGTCSSSLVSSPPGTADDEDVTPEGLAMWQHIAAASTRAASEPERPQPTDAGADAAARIWRDIQEAATRAASEPDFPELSAPTSKPGQPPRSGTQWRACDV